MRTIPLHDDASLRCEGFFDVVVYLYRLPEEAGRCEGQIALLTRFQDPLPSYLAPSISPTLLSRSDEVETGLIKPVQFSATRQPQNQWMSIQGPDTSLYYRVANRLWQSYGHQILMRMLILLFLGRIGCYESLTTAIWRKSLCINCSLYAELS